MFNHRLLGLLNKIEPKTNLPCKDVVNYVFTIVSTLTKLFTHLNTHFKNIFSEINQINCCKKIANYQMTSFSSNTQKPIVTINELYHYFGNKSLRKPILLNINLSIKPKEIVLLTGPSGSGKTTLLTLIGGLRSVQTGSLKFLNRELLGANQDLLVKIRRQIGYIFQGHNLLEFLTVRQNVQMTLELNKNISHQAAKIKAEKILEAVKLGGYGNCYPQQLSGGQKQRVAIARALIGHPKLFLADEPTASLDSQTGKEVILLMRQLAIKQGAAILIVTHDNRILHMGDRIIRIEDGRLSSQKNKNLT